ncbi:ICMT-domain-containing protein [Parathielavia appendiculata]|uniref:Protein-S-isoprenylcysteine O-methyltransferase n=1 Tax=Parathielavia appendiculata TaxID=2587402 RepID=A0AAN6Z3T4_9PEZI|nr:ICMT-domain-containing protein [Parathielavia appendiculata]
MEDTDRRRPWSPDSWSGKEDITAYLPHQPKSLSGIALRSFCLGITFTVGLLSTLAIVLSGTASALWRLPFLLTALSLFHFLEFWTTAAYNTRAAEVSSFLLTSNHPGWAIANAAALLECAVANLLWPGTRWVPLRGLGPYLTAAGLATVAVGQAVRSVAMIHAGQSFNHTVQYRRRSGHVLVTTGVYSYVRHPSYVGFFWWALGVQVVMGNVVGFAAFAWVLWRFFSGRIRREEEALVSFFGREYEEYRRGVPAGIPLVP